MATVRSATWRDPGGSPSFGVGTRPRAQDRTRRAETKKRQMMIRAALAATAARSGSGRSPKPPELIGGSGEIGSWGAILRIEIRASQD